MPTSELLALLVFATAMAFTPGPNTMLSAALAANHGLRRALPFILGVPVGWGVLVLLCALGLGGVVQAWPLLGGAIKWGGLAYMLWLAFKLASAAAGLGTGPSSALRVGFVQGVLLQFVNVKAWMNALLISATWISTATPMAPRLAWVAPLLMLYGLASNLLYAAVGSYLRQWLLQGQRLRWFNRSLALVLLATVVWMAGI